MEMYLNRSATLKDQKRFDQTDKPHYPNFEPLKNHQTLKGTGWGLQEKKVVKKFDPYRQYYPKQVDKEHLRIFDNQKESAFNGAPGGYYAKKPERKLIDMSVEAYELNFPSDSRIPLSSLEMQRQPEHFQRKQLYLHKRALREKEFGKSNYQMGAVAQWQHGVKK